MSQPHPIGRYPGTFSSPHMRGKLRVMLEYFDGRHDIMEYLSLDIVNMIDRMVVKLDDTITIPEPKPENEPFTWVRFAQRLKEIKNARQTLSRWGNVDYAKWGDNLRPGSDRPVIAIQEAGMYTLEHHIVYCEKIGHVGYIKVILHPDFANG